MRKCFGNVEEGWREVSREMVGVEVFRWREGVSGKYMWYKDEDVGHA